VDEPVQGEIVPDDPHDHLEVHQALAEAEDHQADMPARRRLQQQPGANVKRGHRHRGLAGF
jgi:hypothetical protein